MSNSVNDYPFPLNLYRDICKKLGKDLPEKITEDEKKGLTYIIGSINNYSNKELLFKRYKDGESFVDIANEYGFSYQNASSRVAGVIERMCSLYYIGMIFGYENYVLNTNVTSLDLPTRAERALLRNNINTLDDLREYGIDGIRNLRSVGEDTFDEIMDKTWFLWDDSDRSNKLSKRHVKNITEALKGYSFKQKEIDAFLYFVEHNGL